MPVRVTPTFYDRSPVTHDLVVRCGVADGCLFLYDAAGQLVALYDRGFWANVEILPDSDILRLDLAVPARLRGRAWEDLSGQERAELTRLAADALRDELSRDSGQTVNATAPLEVTTEVEAASPFASVTVTATANDGDEAARLLRNVVAGQRGNVAAPAKATT